MQTEEPTATKPEETPPEVQSWHSIFQSWQRAVLSILPIFLATRALFILFGYLGGVLFSSGSAGTSLSLHDLLANWNRGDVTNFILIATSGYTQTGQTLLFPLFPTLIRIMAPLFRGSQLSAGFFLANFAFGGALIVLYRLVENEFDHVTARRTVLYLTIFPTAFVFFVAYSESLFLLLALLSFYMMRRGSWWLAGLFGALAALTQFAGIFLFLIFLCEYVRQQAVFLRQTRLEGPFPQRFYPVLPILASLCIPLALALYFVALHALFGDPFTFIHAQIQASAGFSSLGTALTTLSKQSRFSVAVVHTLLELCTFLLFLFLLCSCFYGPERLAKDQWTYVLFGALLLVTALLFSGSALSTNAFDEPLALMPRLVVSIFPGFILLARLGRRTWFHQAYLLFALPLLAFFLLLFITGQWLF